MTYRDLTDRANECYCENQVFLQFYQYFKIEAKQQQFHSLFLRQSLTTNHTLFLRQSLTTILDTKLKRFHGGFFELEMLEIFTRAFFIKNYYKNMKLFIMALSSFMKCSPQKWKRNHQKNVRHLKNNDNSSHKKRRKKETKTQKKRGKWKTKSITSI